MVRIAVGANIKGEPWHSANEESFFAHIPGWHVVYPICAEDAKGLIEAAARSHDPGIFLEHKGLYRRVEAETLELAVLPSITSLRSGVQKGWVC